MSTPKLVLLKINHMKIQIILYILLLGTYNKSLAQVPDSERNALVAFYNATNGPNWGYKNLNWNTAEPVSTWYGVTVTDLFGIEHVTEIVISSTQNMTGNIPPEIGNLTYLNKLNFYNNNLYGDVPPEIGNLIYLTELDLSFNNLTGIPYEIGNLLNLTHLILWRNEIVGSIPATLGNCTNLRALLLDENQLTGNIPTELSNLTLIENVWLSDNNLMGDITNIYSSWPNLGILGLENTLLTGDLDLSNNPNLVVLWAENNSLSTINVQNGTNSTNLNNSNFNVSNSLNLTCIQVDNENDATSGNTPYTNWNVDETVIFSENCSSLSIFNHNYQNDFYVYPNPVNNFLYLKSNNSPITEIQIYNTIDIIVFSMNNPNGIDLIDLSKLNKGFYFIRLKNKQKYISTKKILKY